MRTFIMKLLPLAFVVILLAGCGRKSADLVLVNGKIVTMDEAVPEAQALAVRGDKILAVGSDEDISAYISSSTEVIDLAGKLAVPGLIDAHGHFMSLGEAKMNLDLVPAENWGKIIALVKEAVEQSEPGKWIIGRGWHQEKWNKMPQPNVDGLPLHNALSKISPDNPVLLDHASGHSCFANAKAMALAGVDSETPDPDGGEIVKDTRGKPIGIFRETAQQLVTKVYEEYQAERTPEEVDADRRKAADLAMRECLSKGITGFHDAGVSFETIDFYQELIDEEAMKIRLYAMINEANEQLEERIDEYRIVGYGDKLSVGCIKRLIDGALGAHGAWLLTPYLSLPTSVGLNTESLEVMRETARIAMEHDFQLATHAIGDRGNRETLDIYQEAFEAFPNRKDVRWRIEHSQHLHPADIPRFGQLGVIASMQGIHCTSDGPWVFKRLGAKRAEEGAYVWQKLMQSGAVICNGTDVPVEDVDPLACFFASVTRKLNDGSVFFGDQCMSREEALRSYTLNAAYAAFEEDTRGSLTPGKFADITVVSKDIMTIPENEIKTTEVLYTIVGGVIEYKK